MNDKLAIFTFFISGFLMGFFVCVIYRMANVSRWIDLPQG